MRISYFLECLPYRYSAIILEVYVFPMKTGKYITLFKHDSKGSRKDGNILPNSGDMGNM